jgi:hypothetical protein
MTPKTTQREIGAMIQRLLETGHSMSLGCGRLFNRDGRDAAAMIERLANERDEARERAFDQIATPFFSIHDDENLKRIKTK